MGDRVIKPQQRADKDRRINAERFGEDGVTIRGDAAAA